MSTALKRRLFSEDEYLWIERQAEERSQYLDGVIYAMAGESPAHGDISANVLGSLVVQLKGTPCRARSKDTKVRSGPLGPQSGRLTAGLYSYPDVLVICGEPEYFDAHRDVVLNPTAIVEVLSETTEGFDRGEKFVRLREWNPSLRDYILISQDRPRLEHYRRQPDGQWLMQDYTGLEAVVVIESIGCTLKLADVYDRVNFPAT
jgi:Uma2 family endonuclease